MPNGGRFAERMWEGRGMVARAMRASLTPAEWAYSQAVRARGAMYDAGWFGTDANPVAAISIGNLTVGGTGKTPIAAWVARELARNGASPAVIRRGYGDDETRVHRMLNPSILVIAGANRLEGMRAAQAVGANVVVLDDGFQHRRVGRDEDWVLIAADGWPDRPRLLPAGPWREPLTALRRATMIVVTRKAAAPEDAARVLAAISAAAPRVPVAVVHLAANELRHLSSDPGQADALPLSAVAGASVSAICAIGTPSAFRAQLLALGATDVRAFVFPDHHVFSEADVRRLAAAVAPSSLVVCTLKDAVKLAPLWPRAAPPLWYVSQRVEFESGVADVSRRLGALTTAASIHPESVPPSG